MLTLTVNGETRQVASAPDTPLLYVLRDELGIMSPKFGCGLAQCGACSVLLDGVEIRSCITAVGAVASGTSEITTVEGLPARWAKQHAQALTESSLHPVQEAWDRTAGSAVRLLPVRHDDQGYGAPRTQWRTV